MEQSSSGSGGGGVMEGFLCPICIIDMKSPMDLELHFEEAHKDDKVVQQFKNVFTKAKQKLQKDNVVQSNATNYTNCEKVDGGKKCILTNGRPDTGGIDLSLWERQKIGLCRSLMGDFIDWRKVAIEGKVVETNKLIIRLEKLITSGIYANPGPQPVAVALRTKKNIERSVVPWDIDNKCSECVDCNKKFTLTFRRHHCRLCGKIFCGDCLDNLDLNIACSVLKLTEQKAAQYVGKSCENNDENESGLKLCRICNELLLRQNKLIQDKSANDNLLHLYDKMKASMKDADSILPKYLKIAESINAGGTEFSLEVASGIRLKLLKAYESVDALSKRIQQLGLDKDKQPSSAQHQKLQRFIRQYASTYLTENMFILPVLPTPDLHEQMLRQKKSKKDLQKTKMDQGSSSPQPPSAVVAGKGEVNGKSKHDINENSLNIQNSPQVITKTNLSKTKTTVSKETKPIQAVSVSKRRDSSWGPVQTVIEDETCSVIGQQIHIVKGYLAQATQAGKQDEIRIFEENLRELMDLERQQRELSHATS